MLPSLALVVAALAAGSPAKPEAASVRQARVAREAEVRSAFASAKVAYPPKELLLRAFKEEGVLELWAGNGKGAPLVQVRSYPVCAKSGGLGPKRRQGDMQVPEGFYRIVHFNPFSSFHLSLGLDYPNASDRLRGGKGDLGGNIYIHGSCVTIGCIPIEDGPIEEVYLAAADFKAATGREIPVHVFPRRMDEEGMRALEQLAAGDAALLAFWRELAPAYAAFEESRRPPQIRVDKKSGAYVISETAGASKGPARTAETK